MSFEPKQASLKIIIHEGFHFEEKFSIINEDITGDKTIINAVSKLTQEYKNNKVLLDDVQHFSQKTLHSFKRIKETSTNKNKKNIIFCCSSISPMVKQQESNEDNSFSNTSAKSNKNLKVRNSKRENFESCPMRLKFIWIENQKNYKICDSSNFNHNHSPIAINFEEYKKKTQNIKFPIFWIHEISIFFHELYCINNMISKENMNQIRTNLIQKYNVKFEDKTYKTNFSKKLMYFILKIKKIYEKMSKKEIFAKIFCFIIKKILHRGANYLKQDQLEILNQLFNSKEKEVSLIYENYLNIETSL